jgi:hypothetical protein
MRIRFNTLEFVIEITRSQRGSLAIRWVRRSSVFQPSRFARSGRSSGPRWLAAGRLFILTDEVDAVGVASTGHVGQDDLISSL